MVLIGMLHHRKDPNKVYKAYAYAAVARLEGAKLLYFTPKSVDFDTQTIKGYEYLNNKWERVISRFPDVIYNAGNPTQLLKSKDIVDQLKNKIPFTSHSIGNKLNVYNRIEANKEFIPYLIPTRKVKTKNDVVEFINEYGKVILKPINGHKGEGIYYIDNDKGRYRLINGQEERLLEEAEFVSLMNHMLNELNYIVQAYLETRTKDNKPYVIRLHVQKNGENEWKITSLYPQIGSEDMIVANLHQGAVTQPIDTFLSQEFNDEYYNIKRYLECFALQFAIHLEFIQNKYFNESLDEIGIDVGLDSKQKIRIFEVNWLPGPPPIFNLELDVVKNLIHYAMYLSSKPRG